MLDFLPTGTNLILKSPADASGRASPVLDGITVVRHSAWGMSFSVAPAEGRPERNDITGPHLLGYFNKYVARWHGGKGFWDSLHYILFVKDGPYAGLSLTQVKVVGPERDQSKAFLLDWGIPQGASFHVQYPGVPHQSFPCNFFLTGEEGAGFMPSDVSRLVSGQKLVADYCERFGISPIRDPFSVIIWRQGEFEGLSLRASKARLDAELEGRQRAALHLTPKPLTDAYDAVWIRAKAAVEVERKALAEELEAPAPAPPAKLSVATALALFQAKATALIQQVDELEALKVAQEHVKALESRIVALKSELNIE